MTQLVKRLAFCLLFLASISRKILRVRITSLPILLLNDIFGPECHFEKTPPNFTLEQQTAHILMDNGYVIRTRYHETSKVVGFLGMSVGCPDKIHLCEKNVAQSIKCTKTENTFTLK